MLTELPVCLSTSDGVSGRVFDKGSALSCCLLLVSLDAVVSAVVLAVLGVTISSTSSQKMR